MPTPLSNSDALAAKDEIRDLVLQYCRAMDRGDIALAATLYEPDARDEHGFNATNTAQEFIDSIGVLLGGLAAVQHNVTNHLIRITGPETAEGEAYVVAYHRAERDGVEYVLITGGRYLDRYSKHEGQWKFAQRKCVADWTHEFSSPLATDAKKSVSGKLAKGRMDAQDPSYAFFTAFPRGERA
ncbi:hypothetical protein AU198_06970 [Mycobacterium sp. GA-1199]|uniref:nuclear transport factor 2 family protein n=1 Tax=Mycobacterium sp. GA-1199 TaxID=1772287 RepID=UPI0007499FEA|nr:nuclear transport factor 2 family protein [Mycobacterium sp. GA-1199]KUI42829.1 hypothetical protein AU198_06970 [Mycobacterium sp. GA-1199]